jgi:sporulation-control protein
VQELEFHAGPTWQGAPRTLALLPFPGEDGLELILDLDRGPRGLTSLLHGTGSEDGRRVLLRLSPTELARGPEPVAEALASRLRA